MRKFAISDIHGHLATFKALLKKIEFSKQDQLFLLGDYIDRGPDSKGVIDLIWELQEEGYQIHCLKGNHEETMQKSLHDSELHSNWLFYGGDKTLESFGVSNLHQVPQRYWDFFESLPLYHEVDQYILVHAGINFDVPHPFEAKHSLLWIRDWYDDINYEWLRDRIVIHGHTPVPHDLIKLSINIKSTRQVIDIDNGCFVTWKPKMGKLCALELDTLVTYFQKNID